LFIDDQLKNLSMSVEQLGGIDLEVLDVSVKEKEHPGLPKDSEVATENVKYRSELISCMFCPKSIRSKSNFSTHVKRFHKDEAVRCKFAYCSAFFNSKQLMEEHCEKVHFLPGMNPVECKECKKWVATEFSLSNHLKKKHPGIKKLKNQNHPKVKLAKSKVKTPSFLTCTFCADSLEFKNKTALHHHTKENHKKEAIKCKSIQCLFYFKTKKDMDEHFETAHQVMNCKFCKLIFVNASLLTSHLKTAHFEKKCKFFRCKFYSDSKEEMETHVEEKHDKTKSGECIYCGRHSVKKLQLSAHVRRFHSHIAIKCDLYKCSHFVKNQADLEKHKKEAHQRVGKPKISLVCLFCQNIILDRSAYFVHIKTHHSDEALRCKYNNCLSFFKSETDLEKHYEEKHARKYCCYYCDYVSSARRNLENHMETHHLPKDIKCPHCPKLFGGKQHLQDHINSNHKPKKKCPFCCELQAHLSRHAVAAPCPVCKKTFQCRRLHATHVRSCKKAFECLECGRKFKIESEFQGHMNEWHKNGQKWKGYKCNKCGEYFVHKSSLSVHKLKAHPAQMRKCNLCGELFVHYTTLYRHKLVVHKIGGFECKECDKMFLERSELSAHLRWNHGKDNPRMQFVDCAVCGRVMKKGNFAEHFRAKH